MAGRVARAAGFAVVVLLGIAPAAAQVITPFDGTTLNGWKAEGTTAAADAGVLTVFGGPGWVRYERPLANFTLTMQVRVIGRGARGGVYLRAWPTFDKETAVPTNGYRVDFPNDVTAPAEASSWERLEIVCDRTTVTVRINEREVLKRDDVPNPQGFVALTVQGGTAEFRGIELRRTTVAELLSSRPARSTSPSPQTTDGVLRPGGRVQLPRPMSEVKPQYTADAMRAKITGGVLLEAVVLADGTVGRIDVIQSLDPHFGLDDSAIAAAKQWRFMPGTQDGTPVAVLVTIELTFTLK